MARKSIRITASIALVILLGLVAAATLKAGPKSADGNAPATDTNVVESKPASDLVPIPLVLPKPQFVGTPQNFQGIANLEKPIGKPREPPQRGRQM
ncbi:MAG: hypothetical protein WBL85_00370, partial [Sedimentisphaerales bacterium]